MRVLQGVSPFHDLDLFKKVSEELLHREILVCSELKSTIFTRVQIDPMYKLTAHFGAQKICFSYFWVKNVLKNLSFTLELSFRYTMVTQKICLEFFVISVFDPCVSRGRLFRPIFRL